ncbi:MAG: hypothetical protein ACRD59_10540 [Candidatus Acidiferrales bacterium]
MSMLRVGQEGPIAGYAATITTPAVVDAIAAGATADVACAVPGVLLAEDAVFGAQMTPTASNAGLVVTGATITADDVVTVRFLNGTAAPITTAEKVVLIALVLKPANLSPAS